MKIYLGTKGLKQTWQEPFPETIKCHKCNGEARIMFVGIEANEPREASESREKYICDLRDNGGKGDYWLHDACAVAVYLCKECFEPNALINQA